MERGELNIGTVATFNTENVATVATFNTQNIKFHNLNFHPSEFVCHLISKNISCPIHEPLTIFTLQNE